MRDNKTRKRYVWVVLVDGKLWYVVSNYVKAQELQKIILQKNTNKDCNYRRVQIG